MSDSSSTALTVRAPGRIASLTNWALRSIGLLAPPPEDFRAGSDYANAQPVADDYDVRQSMSALVAFPWVRACVMARAEDLAALPIRARIGEGKQAKVLDSHPVLDLLKRPGSRTPSVLFRQQGIVDYSLPGNHYNLVVTDRQGRTPLALQRLHPYRTEPVPRLDGQVDAYAYDEIGRKVRYEYERVLHVRGPSWEDGPESLLGSGTIQTLHNDLSAELAASKRQAEQAKRGRPEAIASPAAAAETWAPVQVKQFKQSIQDAMNAAHGGVAVLGGQAKLDILSWSPRDMEFQEMRVFVREGVLAVFGVPPTRLQLPTANYAQSTDAMRQYWSNLQGIAAMFDSEWTRLARMFPGAGDVEIYHDFSAVPYLQEDRTARLGRVSVHILNGMPARAAYAYEGFDDAPVEDAIEGAGTPLAPNRPEDDEPEPTPGPNGDRPEDKGNPRFRIVRESMPRPATESARAAYSLGWIEKVQTPMERRILLSTRRYLRGAASRIALRLLHVMPEGQKAANGGTAFVVRSEDMLEEILGSREEAQHLRAALGPDLLAAIERAYEIAIRQMGGDLEFDPNRSSAEQFIAELVKHVTDTTREYVRGTIVAGLDAGEPVAEIARMVQQSGAFTPSRALNIARTESTRALNAGANDAYADAKNAGISVRKEWLSSRDGHVRPAHAALDGQIVPVSGKFVVPSGEFAGASAAYPGDFSSPAMVCGCRCTTIPVVD
jgi:HK97 family phage portal protein